MKRYYLNIVLLLALLAGHDLMAQKEFSKWFFGDQHALGFTNDSVYLLDTSAMDMHEGCASICDKNGKLLFYTGGGGVYNRNHKKMKYDPFVVFGIKGHWSSSQGTIIVPRPGHQNIFYIFTADGLSARVNPLNTGLPPGEGAFYSIVDMTGDNGLGVVKSDLMNQRLLRVSDEKLTSTMHANGKHVWVLIPEAQGGPLNLHSFLVTENGVDTNSVYTDFGISSNKSITPSGSDLGCMKVSPNGEKIAFVYTFSHMLLLADFDASTGKVSNILKLVTPHRSYGLEFSPNSQYLYVGTHGFTDTTAMIQYDAYAVNELELKKSAVHLGMPVLKDGYYGLSPGSVQRAINGKIYMTWYLLDSLSVVNQPDSHGAKCDWRHNDAPSKYKQKLKFGLPQWIYWPKPKELQAKYSDSNCRHFFDFAIDDTTYVDSLHWWFGDTQSGVQNFSNQFYPQHEYPGLGNYHVEVYIYLRSGYVDTLRKNIFVPKFPNWPDYPDSISHCSKSVHLNYCGAGVKYLWNTGDTTCQLKISSPGTYIIQVTNSKNCNMSDTIILYQNFRPVLRSDTSICANDSLFISELSGHDFKSYFWNSGETQGSRIAYPGNLYVLNAEDSFDCVGTDSFYLGEIPIPYFKLGPDTTLCSYDDLIFRSPHPALIHEWNDTFKGQDRVIRDTGFYKLKISGLYCHYSDSVYVSRLDMLKPDLGPDTVICGIEPISIGTKPIPDYQYKWNTNQKGEYIKARNEGTYILTSQYKHCFSSDTMSIIQEDNRPVFIPNAISINGDGLNEFFPHDFPYDTGMNLMIWNRWGEKIYQGEGKWNGTYMGEKVQEGVYAWQLIYIDCAGNRRVQKGTLTVLK